MAKTVVNYATPAGNGMSCPGDSGGPVFARRGGQEVQIAINTNGDCALHSYGMRIVLYLDDAQVGSKAAPPYTFALAGVTPGSRVLRAVATDGSGDVAATSIAIGVRYSGQPIKDPGAYGAPCASSSECATRLCALGPGTGERRCTVGCDLQNDACPAGSYCDTSVKSAGETVCRSALVDAGADSVDGGGCATAASGGRLSAPWVLLVLALFWGLTPLVAGAFQEETGEQTER